MVGAQLTSCRRFKTTAGHTRGGVGLPQDGRGSGVPPPLLAKEVTMATRVHLLPPARTTEWPFSHARSCFRPGSSAFRARKGRSMQRICGRSEYSVATGPSERDEGVRSWGMQIRATIELERVTNGPSRRLCRCHQFHWNAGPRYCNSR